MNDAAERWREARREFERASVYVAAAHEAVVEATGAKREARAKRAAAEAGRLRAACEAYLAVCSDFTADTSNPEGHWR
jgi:hypothetical protein